MGPYTEKRVAGAFLVVSADLPMLIGQFFGFDARLYAVIMVILSFIPEELCIHYLNKRIEAQESEELKEDLEDDVSRISLTVGIIGSILLVVFFFFWGGV